MKRRAEIFSLLDWTNLMKLSKNTVAPKHLQIWPLILLQLLISMRTALPAEKTKWLEEVNRRDAEQVCPKFFVWFIQYKLCLFMWFLSSKLLIFEFLECRQIFQYFSIMNASHSFDIFWFRSVIFQFSIFFIFGKNNYCQICLASSSWSYECWL